MCCIKQSSKRCCGLYVANGAGMCMEGVRWMWVTCFQSDWHVYIGLCYWHVDIYRWLGVDVHMFCVTCEGVGGWVGVDVCFLSGWHHILHMLCFRVRSVLYVTISFLQNSNQAR